MFSFRIFYYIENYVLCNKKCAQDARTAHKADVA